jgi:hypothetical protein
MNLFTNTELWSLIWEELREPKDYPMVSATLTLTPEKGRVTYRVQHPERKVPTMRQTNLTRGQISLLTEKLQRVLGVPTHVTKVEINLTGNETGEPFIRYTVLPMRK